MNDTEGRLRQLNVQVPNALIEDVRAVGEVDGLSLAACVREALRLWVAHRRRSPDWQACRKERIRRIRAL